MVTESMGVNDLNASQLSFYPNPVIDFLNIVSKEKLQTVEIFNIAGQKVLTQSQLDSSKINLTTLTTGTYVCKVVFENGKTETLKVIKK